MDLVERVETNVEDGVEEEASEVKNGVIETETDHTFPPEIGYVLWPERDGPAEEVQPTERDAADVPSLTPAHANIGVRSAGAVGKRGI